MERSNCKWDITRCLPYISSVDQTIARSLFRRDRLSIDNTIGSAEDLAFACILFPHTVPYGYNDRWDCMRCEDARNGCPANHQRGNVWENEVCRFYCRTQASGVNESSPGSGHISHRCSGGLKSASSCVIIRNISKSVDSSSNFSFQVSTTHTNSEKLAIITRFDIGYFTSLIHKLLLFFQYGTNIYLTVVGFLLLILVYFAIGLVIHGIRSYSRDLNEALNIQRVEHTIL